jgi:hypothetical protein
MSNTHVRFGYTGAALPGNGAVVVMLATAPTSDSLTGVIGGAGHMGNFFAMNEIRRVFLSMQNDQAGTLKEFKSMDHGANWVQINPDIAVVASAANSENQYDFLVEPYADWKLTWTNGVTPQTVFRIDIVGTGQRVVAN